MLLIILIFLRKNFDYSVYIKNLHTYKYFLISTELSDFSSFSAKIVAKCIYKVLFPTRMFNFQCQRMPVNNKFSKLLPLDTRVASTCIWARVITSIKSQQTETSSEKLLSKYSEKTPSLSKWSEAILATTAEHATPHR